MPKKSGRQPAQIKYPCGEWYSGTPIGFLTLRELQYSNTLVLWRIFLHLRCWGLPEYELLDARTLPQFCGVVAKGSEAVFAFVEDAKRAVLYTGLGGLVKDDWLTFMVPSFDPVTGVPPQARDELGRICHEMWGLLVRLDPAAAPIALDEQTPIRLAEQTEPVAEPPSALQQRILRALKGKTLTLDAIAAKLDGDRSHIHQAGLKQLMESGRIKNSRAAGGYYRPDAPPSDFSDE